MTLSNRGRYSRKLTTLFGDIEYTRTQLAPTDKKETEEFFGLTSKKSVYPLDSYLGIDNLPFKISVKMMVALAREAVDLTQSK